MSHTSRYHAVNNDLCWVTFLAFPRAHAGISLEMDLYSNYEDLGQPSVCDLICLTLIHFLHWKNKWRQYQCNNAVGIDWLGTRDCAKMSSLCATDQDVGLISPVSAFLKVSLGPVRVLLPHH